MQIPKLSFTSLLILFFAYTATAQTPCPEAGKPLPADTTIVLANGTTLTFNRCDFFEIKDCLEVKEIRTLSDLQSSGLTLQDNEGNVLQTCGMVSLKFGTADDCSNSRECISNPVRIRIPMLRSPCLSRNNGTNRLYRIPAEGKPWEPVQGGKEITIDGKPYFEFFTNCPGKYNCDKILPTIKVKFKAKKYRSISLVNISSNCPPMTLDYHAKKRKNIVLAKLHCISPDSIAVKIRAINSNGSEEIISKPLSAFKTNFRKTRCGKKGKKTVRKVLGIFPLKERRLYKKYIID